MVLFDVAKDLVGLGSKIISDPAKFRNDLLLSGHPIQPINPEDIKGPISLITPIEDDTEPESPFTAETMRALEGKRIKCDADGAIYLILDGKARHIANGDVYRGMYGENWGNIQMCNQDFALQLPKGPSITANPPLISPSSGGVYLIDDGKKRHVANPDTMSKYSFDWGRIVNNHDNAYPDGEQIRA